MKNNFLFVIIVIFCCQYSNAQVGMTGNNPNKSSVLDLQATNKGLLIPRVALTSTTVAAPIITPVVSLMVYNTATVGDVVPGYYYWDGSKWVMLVNDTNIKTTAWLPGGNTNGSVKNLGTIDNMDLPFISNNIEKMRLTTAGNLGIGVVAPTQKLDIFSDTPGAVKIVDGTEGLGKVLTSNVSGVAAWATPASITPTRQGIFPSSVLTINSSGSTNANSQLYIDLTPGNWILNIGLAIVNNSSSTNWFGGSFSSSNSSVTNAGFSYLNPGLPTHTVRSAMVAYSGSPSGNSNYNMLLGAQLISVPPGPTRRIYFLFDQLSGFVFKTDSWENYLYAVPIN